MKVKLLTAIAVFVGILLSSIFIRLYAQNQKLTLESNSKSTLYRQEISQAIESNNQRHQQEITVIRNSERLNGMLQAFDAMYKEPKFSYDSWGAPKTAYQTRIFQCFDKKVPAEPWFTAIVSNYLKEDQILQSCKSAENIFIASLDESSVIHLYHFTEANNDGPMKQTTTLPTQGNSDNQITIKLLKWKTLPERAGVEWFLLQVEEHIDKNINPQWETKFTNKFVYEWLDASSPVLIEKCIVYPNTWQEKPYCSHVVSTKNPVYGQ